MDHQETRDQRASKDQLDFQDQQEPPDQWDFQARRDQLENKDSKVSQDLTDNKEILVIQDHLDFQAHPPFHHGWEAVFQTDPLREEMKSHSQMKMGRSYRQRRESQRTTHSSKSTDTTLQISHHKMMMSRRS